MKSCKILVIYVCKARLTIHTCNTSSIADSLREVNMDTEAVLCMFYECESGANKMYLTTYASHRDPGNT